MARDVSVLIQCSSYSTRGREQPEALLDTVLEMNKSFHIITVCVCEITMTVDLTEKKLCTW